MKELPKGWANAMLAELVSPDRPRELPQDFPNLPFVGMEHVEAHSMRLLGTVPAGGLKSSAVHFQAGDVLYGRLRPYLNKVLLAKFEGLCSAEFIVFGKHAEMSSEWLAYFLNSSAFVSFASHLNTGDRPRVDFDQIGSYKLFVAPRPEQDRIVAEIDKQFTRLDAATAALKRVQANLKRYRASVLKAACEGRLVPTEAELARKQGRDYEPADKLLQRILRERRARWEAHTLAKMQASSKPAKDDHWKQKYKEPSAPDTSTLPPLPGGWCWASTDQITTLITDGEHITPPRTTSGVYLLSARNIRDGELSLEDVDYISAGTYSQLSIRLPIVAGDVLLSCSGSVGRSCVVPKGVTFSLVRSVAVLKPLLIHSDYMGFALRSRFVQDQIRQKSTQTAQSNIFQAQIKSLILPIPPLCEQDRIVAACTSFTEEIVRCELNVKLSSTRASSLRQAILRNAFTGQLVPQDPTDEPASALLERIRTERSSSAKQMPTRRSRKEPTHA